MNSVQRIRAWITSLPYRSRRGQGMVEYALILVLVAVVVVLVLSTLGNTIKDTFQDVINGLQTK